MKSRLLWFLLWSLAIAVGLAPASPLLPIESTDLSNYPWIFLREGKPLERSEELSELIVVGDIMLGRGVGNQANLFEQVSSWLNGAGMLVGNLEGVISAGKEIPVMDALGETSGFSLFRDQGQISEYFQETKLWQPLYLIAPPSSVALLQAAGFDVLAMANNHAMDAGTKSLEESTLKLRRAGIDVVGVGPGLGAAYHPLIRIINGRRIAILAFTVPPPLAGDFVSEWMVATWDRERILEAVQTAHSHSDFVLVMAHWGEEYMPQANAWQREVAKELAQAGADLVVGHHPHTIQAVELIGKSAFLRTSKDRVHLVAYSLGNFVFDQYSPDSLPGLALRVFLDSRGLRAVQAILVKSVPETSLIDPVESASLLERVAPEPTRAMFSCTRVGCEIVQKAFSENKRLDSSLAIPWSGQIDLSGDGIPEVIRREGVNFSIFQGNSKVWQSPSNWNVVDFALGDPNDDGRAEVVVALHKTDPFGVLQSHPFILGFRGGLYRLLWGGSAVAQPIRELEIGDVDGDGVHELIVVEEQRDGKQTLAVWRWHGWGFNLGWRSLPALLRDLRIVRCGDKHLLEIGVVER